MKIKTSSNLINQACNIAFSDIEHNIRPYKSGLLEKEQRVILAGGAYNRPWTRDASINIYNALAYYDREVALNTLLAVLERRGENSIYIAGQYWDSVIWAFGAERYYEITKDDYFLDIAINAIKNSLKLFEGTEYSSDYKLFRGPAVYGDGVSAYPGIYGNAGHSCFILDFLKTHPERKAEKGVGIPMHALSTNCAYYNAYMTVYRLTNEQVFLTKAEELKSSILYNFYKDSKLKYITGKYGDFYQQEGLGIAFGLKFDVLPTEILYDIYISKNGIPCVYPTFERYRKGDDVGRHSGTVWPFIQCFYANAILEKGQYKKFDFEFLKLAENAVRDKQFFEVYHPQTGLPYGGLQEDDKVPGLTMFKSAEHQTWSATGFISMLLYGIAGLKHKKGYIEFEPYLPFAIDYIEIEGIHYADAAINIAIEGKGYNISRIDLDGEAVDSTAIFDNSRNITNLKIIVSGDE